MKHPITPRGAWVILFTLAATMPARAAIRNEIIEYRHGDTTMEGVLVFDDFIEIGRASCRERVSECV